MSRNASQPTPLEPTTPTTPVTPETVTTPATPAAPAESQQPSQPESETPKPEPAAPVAVISVSEVAAIVAAEVAKALAAKDAKDAEDAEAVKAAKTATVETAPVEEETNGPLYGNQDRKKQFDLRKLLPTLKTLPSDKVLIVMQKHDILSNGTPREDETARRVQIISPADYEANTTPDKATGQSIYDTLLGTPGEGRGYVAVHKPE